MLERYVGDGVMVIFNDPVQVENPALQAVLMALELRDAIRALTEKWRGLGHDWLHRHCARVCHARCNRLQGTVRFIPVSNVASWLCDEAILISPRVLTKVEPVGEFALEGIRRPIAASNVHAALPLNA